MERIFIRFDQRDFSKPLPTPRVRFAVNSMTWSVENGGPEEAEFTAYASPTMLMTLPQLLRSPVTVSDAYGGAMWWGYVDTVEIHLSGLIYSATLDGMANRVAMRWTQEDPVGGTAQRWDYQTAWADDATSQAQYGIKEAVVDLGEGRQADAEAARATHLAKLKGALTKSTPGEAVEQPYGVLKLRGWYETMGWRYHVHDRGYVGNTEWQGTNYIFGQATETRAVGQLFLAPGAWAWSATDVWLRAFKVGAPADNFFVELRATSAGEPTTGLAWVPVAGSTLETEPTNWLKMTFDSACVITPGTVYAIVLSRSGAVDATNYYGVQVEAGVKLGYNLLKWYPWATVTPNVSMVMGLFGKEDATGQMSIVGATYGGQFLRGVSIKNGSGVSMGMYRTGKKTALEEMEEALAMGSSTGEQMLARISADRYLIIEQRPAASDPTLLVTATGEVRYRNGRSLIGSDLPVGRWARVESLLDMGGDYGAKGVVFLTRAEWRGGKVKVWWD